MEKAEIVKLLCSCLVERVHWYGRTCLHRREEVGHGNVAAVVMAHVEGMEKAKERAGQQEYHQLVLMAEEQGADHVVQCRCLRCSVERGWPCELGQLLAGAAEELWLCVHSRRPR